MGEGSFGFVWKARMHPRPRPPLASLPPVPLVPGSVLPRPSADRPCARLVCLRRAARRWAPGATRPAGWPAHGPRARRARLGVGAARRAVREPVSPACAAHGRAAGALAGLVRRCEAGQQPARQPAGGAAAGHQLSQARRGAMARHARRARAGLARAAHASPRRHCQAQPSRAAARSLFRHPNIVQLLGWWEEDEELFVVMEYMRHSLRTKRCVNKARPCRPRPLAPLAPPTRSIPHRP